MENLSVALQANIDQFQRNIGTAIQDVSKYNAAASGVKDIAPTFKAPKLSGADLTGDIQNTLNALQSKLQVVQGNVELFGNQFAGDKLKIQAYQRALNDLLAAGLSPTSKEVLRLANHIEELGTKTARQQAILDRQAGKMQTAFKGQEGILQNLQRNLDQYRIKMQQATDTKSLNNYAQTVKVLESQIAGLKNQSSALAGAANSTNQQMNKLSGSAGQVGMEFARIIQDAPYGMMGIGNNIQQLTSNFGQLRAQAGSTRAALGAALTSLITPASLLTIGIAALTSGWTAYQMWSQKSAKATKEAGDAMETAAQAAADYVKAQDSLTQARLNGEREAQREVTTLRVLYNQTQSTTLSIKERKAAADEILKQYPESFKGLTQEEILLGKAATAYQKLTGTLLENARARAGLDLLTDNSKQQIVNEQRIAALREKLIKSTQKYNSLDVEKGTNDSFTDRVKIVNEQYGVAQEIKESQKELNALVAQNNKLKADSLRLEKEISGTVLTTGGTETGEGKSTKTDTKQTDYLKELQVAFDQSTKEAILFGNTYDEMSAKAGLFKQAMIGLMSQGLMPQSALIQGLKSSYDLFSGQTIPIAEGALKRFAETDLSALKESIDGVALSFSAIPAAIAPMSESMKAFLAEQAAMAEAAMAQIEISAEQMTSFMQGSIANALVGLGEAFGQLAISGDVSGFFDSIIGMVADFAGNFGKMLIGAGVAALAFESLLANPAGAIAAGVALVAAASAVKSVLAKGPSGGGGVAPSISGMGGGYNQPRMGTSYEGEKEMRFRIEGQDLVAIVNRQNYKTGRIG